MDKFTEYSKMTARVMSEKINNLSLKCFFTLVLLFLLLIIFNKIYIDNSLPIKTYFVIEISLKKTKE